MNQIIPKLLAAFRSNPTTHFLADCFCAIYGSLLYKPLSAVRDIDVLAISDGSKFPTSRLDIWVPYGGGSKKASVYILHKTDFLDDVYHGKFGLRWPANLFHGFGTDKDSVLFNDYYALSIASISYYCKCNLHNSSYFFLKNSHMSLCALFPMYIKSIIYYHSNMLYRILNHALYQNNYLRIMESYIDILNIKPNISIYNLAMNNILSEIICRKKSSGKINLLVDKLSIVLSFARCHRNFICSQYGVSSFDYLQNNFDKMIDICNSISLDENDEINFEYIGEFFLRKEWHSN
jgi:hypothetical protein